MADVETEREMSRGEVAAYLHEFAEKLDDTAGTTSNEERATGSENRSESAVEEIESNDTASTTDREGTTQRGQDEGRVTFTLGNQSATVNPPETIQFTVAVDSTAGMLESGAHETVSFTLDWDAEPTDDGELGLH